MHPRQLSPGNHPAQETNMAPIIELAFKEGTSYLFFALLIGLTFLF